MSAPTLPQAIARVVTWHNRHPLARRITPTMVQGVGVVALPFVVDGAGAGASPVVVEPSLDGGASDAAPPASLRQRALSGVHTSPLDQLAAPTPLPKRRAFSERFLAQPSLARIEAFALRHGLPAVSTSRLGPLREIVTDSSLCRGAGTVAVYLCTAAIEDGEQRVRVLWGNGQPPAVLGPRLWSRGRFAACGVFAASALLVGLTPAASSLWPRAVPASATVQARVAASAPAVVDVPSLEPLRAQVPVHVRDAVPGLPVHAPVVVVAAPEVEATPIDAEPPPPAIQGPAAWPVNIRPHIDPNKRRGARQHGATLRNTAKLVPAPSGAPGAVYALVARSTKSRAASEMMLGFMQAAVAGHTKSSQHTEVLPDARGWRASWWPFVSRQEAERARAKLASNGLNAEIVEF